MIRGAATAMRVALLFTDRAFARPVLGRIGALTRMTVLRGRITPAEAWYEIEIEGSLRRVRKAVRLSRPWLFQKENGYAP